MVTKLYSLKRKQLIDLKLKKFLYLEKNLSVMAESYSTEKKSIEEAKEVNWKRHFSEYGRGVSMYRTTEIYELILDGIPDKLRCELWLTFSGAIHQVFLLHFYPFSHFISYN